MRHLFAHAHELCLSSSLDPPLLVCQLAFIILDIILVINDALLCSSQGDDGGKPAQEILLRLKASEIHQNTGIAGEQLQDVDNLLQRRGLVRAMTCFSSVVERLLHRSSVEYVYRQ